jgi:hypothetical protein
MTRRLILFELNEFNDALLKQAIAAYGLANLAEMVKLPHTFLATEDTYESDYLEPWVQWVSLHTGVPASKHQIKHLGDVPDLSTPQIWEVLAERGVTTGVWGVLNGSRGKQVENNLFFVPDPWTFSEQAYPTDLDRLIGLPRYLATNRANISPARFALEAARFLRVLVEPSVRKEFLRWAPVALAQTVRDRGVYAGFTLVEYISGLLFLERWRRYKPQFGVLFLNCLAHCQHYYWESKPLETNHKLRFCFEFLDRLVGALLAEAKASGTELVITNALSQKNTLDEPPWCSYRPLDFAKFLKFAGVTFDSVSPLMSYDALVYFPNEAACRQARDILEGATVGEQKLFLVETYDDNPKKLFFRFQFTDELKADACQIGGKRFKFWDQFTLIATRTGKHIPKADVYSSLPGIPKKQPNHQVFDNIVDFFAA